MTQILSLLHSTVLYRQPTDQAVGSTTFCDERFFAVARRAQRKMPAVASDRSRNNATGKKSITKCSLSHRLIGKSTPQCYASWSLLFEVAARMTQ